MDDDHQSYERVGETREILTFRLAQTAFGIPVAGLCEVVDLVEIVRVQGAMGQAEGIINYRGVVIPVLDVRKIIGLPRVRHGLDASIIITDAAEQQTGLIVDQVLDVIGVADTAIDRPALEGQIGRYVSGVAKLDKGLVPVLDLQKILAHQSADSGELAVGAQPDAAEDGAHGSMPGGLQAHDDKVRAILRSRAQELSRPVEQPGGDRKETAAFVRFALGTGAYGIRAEYAREIAEVPNITPVPCTPEHVMGVVNLRGAIIPVIGLAKFLGVEGRSHSSGRERLVVAEAEEARLALFVDEVLDLSEVAMEELGPPAVKIGEEAAGVVEAEFDCEGRAVCGLHLPAIVKGLMERDEGVVGRGA